jgi:undecaprenyl-diphosphatase
MNIFEAVVGGLVQGLTEFIPVSSSGHLELTKHLFGFATDNFHLFMEFVNIGTLAVLLVFYRKRILEILQDVFVKKNYRLAVNIVITSIPAGAIGLFMAHFIASAPFFSALSTIAVAMGGVGVLMIFIDRLPSMSKLKDENRLTRPRALLIGLAQVLALIPGTSRSGTTIVAGRLTGLNSRSATNYSFLASIPIMCGVVLKTFMSSGDREYFVNNLGVVILSNIVAFVVGMIAIRFVIEYVKKPGALRTFGKYRVVVAAVVLIFALISQV